MNISTKKMLVCSSLAVSLLASYAEMANAVPVAISTAGKDTVTFVVENLANATGFGGHFSTGKLDGYGGTYAECHFLASPVPPAAPVQTASLLFLCYDGYQSDTQHVNSFRLDLGPKYGSSNNSLAPNISHATITVSRRGVQVDVTKIATSTYTTERIPYTISSFMPLRESSGFFKGSTIYYEFDGPNQSNGVLAQVPSREGTGYRLKTAIANPTLRP